MCNLTAILQVVALSTCAEDVVNTRWHACVSSVSCDQRRWWFPRMLVMTSRATSQAVYTCVDNISVPTYLDMLIEALKTDPYRQGVNLGRTNSDSFLEF